MNSRIYEMKLHEITEARGMTILRVPGGWIYEKKDSMGNLVNTFIPFSDEFYTYPPSNESPPSLTQETAY